MFASKTLMAMLKTTQNSSSFDLTTFCVIIIIVISYEIDGTANECTGKEKIK